MFNPDYEKRILKHSSAVARKLFSIYDSASTPTTLDRFIPRRANNSWYTNFSSNYEPNENTPQTYKKKNDCCDSNKDSLTYSCLLQNELLDTAIDNVNLDSGDQNENNNTLHAKRRLFNYKPLKKQDFNEQCSHSFSPVSIKSQKLLKSPMKATRKISKFPFKVLDAPSLQDDFYLNLVDWSSQNMLAVGLSSSVYLWSASTSQVTKLCDFSTDTNTVTSVLWNEPGNLVAIGTHLGYVTVWDVAASKQISKLHGHSARIAALALNGDILSSGSRDRLIIQRDTRIPAQYQQRRLIGHRQEVCGLKWSPNNQYLASGGNDNRLCIWNQHSLNPYQSYHHIAAVKAIAWSPHHHGLLASGGGTSDGCVRFWNTLIGKPMQYIDTGSQVCNLVWSKHSSELVSTHGYSENQIVVWKYPSLKQLAKLTGHSCRVLYLALSPDGQTIVTGAGDETLRFWNVFSKVRNQKETRSVLNLFTSVR